MHLGIPLNLALKFEGLVPILFGQYHHRRR